MPLTPAEPIHQDYLKMLFDGTFAHVAELAPAINDALAINTDRGGRLLVNVKIEAMTEGDLDPWWTITMTRVDGTVVVLEGNLYAVVSSLGKIRALNENAYFAEFKPDPAP